MPTSVTMPQLGESVTEGTVTRWLKQEGDRVEADEPLLEVSTDKVDTEIPSPASGTLSKIVVAEDETVDVGAELAVIAGDGESSGDADPSQPAAAPAAPEQPAPEQPAAEQPAAQEPAAAQAPAEPEPIQPAAQPAEPAAPAQPAASGSGGGGGSAEGTKVTMPALGESVTEGTVTRWLKQVGDSIEVDEPLLEVSTDKVDTEIPSPAAGTVLEIKVAEDETVEVGAELATIGSSSGASAGAPAQPSTPPAASQQAQPQQAQQPQAQPTQPAAQAQPAAPAQPASQSAPVAAAAPSQPAAQAAPSQPAPVSTGTAPSANGSGSGDGTGYVTPLVRKLASEHGIELSSLTGTGVGGRIRKQDVLDAAERRRADEAARAQAARAQAQAPAPSAPAQGGGRPAAAALSPLRGRTEKLSRMRQVIAKRMVESLQTAAQLTTVIEVDVTRIAKLRDQAKADFVQRHGVKLSFLPFFALATVEALRQHPKLNASLDVDAGTVTYHDAENLGIAVDAERGLMVPVVHNAGDLNLSGLARRIADLAERTRANKLNPDEIANATFTLTNTGSRGALFDTPIFPQPQVAMLGTGAVVKRAVVVDDQRLGEIIVPRSMVYLALSYDHRLVDGADAARFLATIKERLEAGAFEAELGLS
jgi:pyruvate dehydrogenase E2 component (dihydrolipoamide acetyltransferase)